MNKLALIILLIVVGSCTYDNQKQQYLYGRLSQWDYQMADYYPQIVDSLSSLNTKDLSVRNRHYHTLLSAIAGTWSGITLTSDSALAKASSWYQSNRDFRNVCRAKIFNRSNLEEQYDRLKEVEEIFSSHRINDSLTEAYLYMYLSEAIFRSSAGVSLSRQTAAQKSESYRRMSVDIFMKIGRLREAQNLLINSYSTYPVYITQEKRLENLKEIELFDTIYPEVKSKMLIIYGNYFLSKNPEQGFKYIKDYITFEGDEIFRSKAKLNAFVLLTTGYQKAGKLDSALHYAKIYNKALIELQSDAYEGYRHLSSVYESMGDTKNAYENYLIFHRMFSYRRNAQYQDALLQNRAMALDFEKSIKRLKRERTIGIYSALMVSGGLFAFAIFFAFKQRVGVAGNERVAGEYKAQLTELNELYKKGKFTNEVLKASAGLMPSFIDSMAKEAGRCRKISQETFDNILNNISSMRQSGREIISDVSKSEEFAEFFPVIASYKELSSYEKVVLALFEMGYSPKEISNLISTTPASVRSIKAKIKDKLPSLSMSGEGENQSEDN